MRTTLAFLLVVLPGCGSSGEPAEPTEEQIVQQLKDLVATSEGNRKWSGTFPADDRNAAGYYEYTFTDVGYDVRKSDSLVRPYEGEIVIKWSSKTHNTTLSQGEAISLKEGVYCLSVAYENGKWFPYGDKTSLAAENHKIHLGTPNVDIILYPAIPMEPLTDELINTRFGRDPRPVFRGAFKFK